MQDFLTFKTFISPTMLLLFYYIGAIVMPIFIWFASRWIINKVTMMEESYRVAKQIVWGSMRFKYRVFFISVFIMMFLFMEIIWRMMFEFLIAYMQIREALVLS
ncbi:MAG: hypothetical protein DSZ07_04570 [Sulfurovum sp.]|nr:MAG: hypothetical protein DSZ07_04570 [Sulfurovum sp.]